MAHLFEPLRLRSLTLRNRIGMAPMCMYSAEDGKPGDWHLVHLGARASGGCGLVITGATAVEARGRISPADTGMWQDRHVRAWRFITKLIREQGAVPCVQLAHAGRKAGRPAPWESRQADPPDAAWEPVAPSAEAFSDDYPAPKVLTEKQIEKLADRWSAATRRAYSAGFQAIELHMAHGFLLHEFLSPLSNHRDDEFGGSLENRMRFPLMVAQAARLEWPDNLPVIVRISATDWIDGGWDIDQSLEFVKRLKDIGIDMIDCSSGGILPVDPDSEASQSMKQPGFQVAFAARIRKELEIPTAAVGLITKSGQANNIILEDKADMVLLGRELLRNPYWAHYAATELGHEPPWPEQYARVAQ